MAAHRCRRECRCNIALTRETCRSKYLHVCQGDGTTSGILRDNIMPRLQQKVLPAAWILHSLVRWLYTTHCDIKRLVPEHGCLSRDDGRKECCANDGCHLYRPWFVKFQFHFMYCNIRAQQVELDCSHSHGDTVYCSCAVMPGIILRCYSTNCADGTAEKRCHWHC